MPADCPRCCCCTQVRPDKPFRLAVGSFVEDYNNRVEIITRERLGPWHLAPASLPPTPPRPRPTPVTGSTPPPPTAPLTCRARARAVDDRREGLRCAPGLSFQHPYPPTKVAFIPDRDCSRQDLLATSGDFLRLWRITDEGVVLEKLLNNVSRGKGRAGRRKEQAGEAGKHARPALPARRAWKRTHTDTRLPPFCCRTSAASSARPSRHSTGTTLTRAAWPPPASTAQSPSGMSNEARWTRSSLRTTPRSTTSPGAARAYLRPSRPTAQSACSTSGALAARWHRPWPHLGWHMVSPMAPSLVPPLAPPLVPPRLASCPTSCLTIGRSSLWPRLWRRLVSVPLLPPPPQGQGALDDHLRVPDARHAAAAPGVEPAGPALHGRHRHGLATHHGARHPLPHAARRRAGAPPGAGIPCLSPLRGPG
jgi:hypothetical protein